MKTVLVTGASGGIGLACARHLAGCGHKVYAGTRNPERLQAQDLPPGLQPLYLQVQDEVQIAQAMAEVGRVDVLINNAGYGLIGTEEMVTVQEAQTLFDVNFFGVMRMTQAVLPAMRARRAGHIIHIGSQSGFYPNPLLSLYAAAKFALEGFAISLATNVKPWNIHVSIVAPGPIASEFAAYAQSGTRLNPNPYEAYIERNLSRWHERTRHGETTGQLAQLMEQIINSTQPSFRYTLHPEVTAKAKALLCDPSGEALLAKLQAEFL